jgi:hypothetical protein
MSTIDIASIPYTPSNILTYPKVLCNVNILDVEAKSHLLGAMSTGALESDAEKFRGMARLLVLTKAGLYSNSNPCSYFLSPLARARLLGGALLRGSRQEVGARIPCQTWPRLEQAHSATVHAAH